MNIKRVLLRNGCEGRAKGCERMRQVRKGTKGCEGVRKASSVEREKGTAQLQSKGCEGVQRGAKCVSRRAADRRVERRASTSVESSVDAVET